MNVIISFMNNHTKFIKRCGNMFDGFCKQFKVLMFLVWLLPALSIFGQNPEPTVITSDIDNFWVAYDRITQTKDSAVQYEYLNNLFIEKASPGQRAMMELKRYTPKSYVEVINRYPLFWNSIRANTLRSKTLAAGLKADIAKLKILYPDLKPAKIYFTIGALNSGGTIKDGMVLIGSEIAMTDQHTVSSELPDEYKHLKSYFDGNPIGNIAFTNVHEYVHTQQKTTDGSTLLAQSVLEGVAEFVAVKATGKPSTLAAMAYARANDERIKQRFTAQMFNPFAGFWLYSNAANEFNARDLGYYVGYAICEKYYAKTKDKKRSISEMINLNYNDSAQLGKFIERSGYFKKSVKKLEVDFERSRPYVVGIKPFKNGATDVDPTIGEITIEFSAPMDKKFRNFSYGPLGENNSLKVKKFKSLSEDGKSLTLEIELKPKHRQQLTVAQGFRSVEGISLKPYIVDITTNGN